MFFGRRTHVRGSEVAHTHDTLRIYTLIIVNGPIHIHYYHALLQGVNMLVCTHSLACMQTRGCTLHGTTASKVQHAVECCCAPTCKVLQELQCHAAAGSAAAEARRWDIDAERCKRGRWARTTPRLTLLCCHATAACLSWSCRKVYAAGSQPAQRDAQPLYVWA